MQLSPCQIFYKIISLDPYDDPVGIVTVVLILHTGIKAYRAKQLDHTSRERQGGPLCKAPCLDSNSVVIQSVASVSAWIWIAIHSHSCVTRTRLFLSLDLPHPINEDSIGLL